MRVKRPHEEPHPAQCTAAMQTPARDRMLPAQSDVFAEEQQATQDQLDALLDQLAPPLELRAQQETEREQSAAPSLAQLQNFLAGDAEPLDKIEQLVSFLAGGPGQPESALALAADGPDTDVFADEQAQKQKALEDLVDSLASNNSATALLATDVGAHADTHTSFLGVVGAAVLLLVAVVLAAVSMRPRAKLEQASDEDKDKDKDKDFGYRILYE
ncbi:unnamed protein product [Phytophthora fragariaefolia]|uniref:Unnamed protein product n=1 Tax=Phytophthora fragariaefolia TaxID=1490495 RepID=A0A9W7D4N1_9STRA|nr:unnamed protein product [Phytophthora fragariaefolia]